MIHESVMKPRIGSSPTWYPCGSSLLAMIRALSRNAASSMIHEKESYEFQPLGGSAVSCCCRRPSPAEPAVGAADQIRDVRRRATQSMPAIEMRCGRLQLCVVLRAGPAAAGNYSEAAVDCGGGVRWRSGHMHACMRTQVWRDAEKRPSPFGIYLAADALSNVEWS